MENRATFEINDLPEHTLVCLSGVIDEFCYFPAFTGSDSRELLVDLGNLQSMNSSGIRLWIEWMESLQYSSLKFQKCPKVFIDQVNNVIGFIPKRSRIISFYVPYFSEITEEEGNILFRRGINFKNGKIIEAPDVIDSSLHKMTIDVAMEKYLRFLPEYGL